MWMTVFTGDDPRDPLQYRRSSDDRCIAEFTLMYCGPIGRWLSAIDRMTS